MQSISEVLEDVIKPRRPSDSAFKQQQLPAWQPNLTAGTVLPMFIMIGIAFIPVGIGLLYLSDKVKEVAIDYTDCKNSVGKKCSEVIEEKSDIQCNCTIPFVLEQDFKCNVYMYYALTNFYQNHRRYVKSRDDDQLLGRLSHKLSSDCAPFQVNEEKSPIAPCGAIANSFFSDELVIEFVDRANNRKRVPLLRTNIAWPSDKQIKFRNPPGNLTQAFSGFGKPQSWKKNIWELDTENPDNNGFQNEDLIVWMRTAALPTFRKLYRHIDHSKTGFTDGLPKGNYSLFVDYSYMVTKFEGTKRVILSTTSLLGGKNPFLGIVYIIVGCWCLLLGIIFLFVHLKCSKKTTEIINISPHTPYEQFIYRHHYEL